MGCGFSTSRRGDRRSGRRREDPGARGVATERRTQGAPATVKARHHRADGATELVGRLPIRQVFEVDQEHDVAELGCELPKCSFDFVSEAVGRRRHRMTGGARGEADV